MASPPSQVWGHLPAVTPARSLPSQASSVRGPVGFVLTTINSFAKGGDGGGPSECDNQYHSDDELVVALSTGWYNGGSRCLNKIRINANGRSVLAKVVDECDSVNGCDSEHDFQPPCPNNIVDASTMLLGQGGWKSCSESHPLTESHSSTTLASTDLPLALILILFRHRLPPLYQPVDKATTSSSSL